MFKFISQPVEEFMSIEKQYGLLGVEVCFFIFKRVKIWMPTHFLCDTAQHITPHRKSDITHKKSHRVNQMPNSGCVEVTM